MDAGHITDSERVLPYNIVLGVYENCLRCKLAMIDCPRRIIQLGYEDSREKALLIRNVLLCDLWQFPITYSDDLVLNHVRVMLRSGSGPLIQSAE